MHARRVHHIYNDAELLRRLKHGSALVGLLVLRDFKKLLAEREVELLVEARHAGMAWDVIGGLLGVTRQAAYQRWKRLMAAEERGFDSPEDVAGAR
jgi:hypothetical protein